MEKSKILTYKNNLIDIFKSYDLTSDVQTGKENNADYQRLIIGASLNKKELFAISIDTEGIARLAGHLGGNTFDGKELGLANEGPKSAKEYLKKEGFKIQNW